MKEIFLFRHGQTDLNLAGIVQGQGVDSELNQLGLKQAKLIFEKFRSFEFDLLITSELRRSQQTFMHFIDNEYPHQINSDINEINWGIHEGRPTNNKTKAEFRKLINSWKAGDFSVALEGGESGEELIKRVINFWNYLYNVKASRIAVCSHGRVMRAMLSYFVKSNFLHMESFQHENACLYHLKVNDKGNHIIVSNDVCHLNELNEV